jgi:hypothetical protein
MTRPWLELSLLFIFTNSDFRGYRRLSYLGTRGCSLNIYKFVFRALSGLEKSHVPCWIPWATKMKIVLIRAQTGNIPVYNGKLKPRHPLKSTGQKRTMSIFPIKTSTKYTSDTFIYKLIVTSCINHTEIISTKSSQTLNYRIFWTIGRTKNT